MVDNPRSVLGWSGYVGIPGYMDRGHTVQGWTIPGVSWEGLVTWESRDTWTGGYSLATLYMHTVHVYSYGRQSQECPGMVWLRGNPGIHGQGGSLATLYMHTVSYHGLVTWESQDTWTGGGVA